MYEPRVPTVKASFYSLGEGAHFQVYGFRLASRFLVIY